MTKLYEEIYVRSCRYYPTGGAGYFDEDGYMNVVTRVDDIIHTGGHRLSTSQMEKMLISHPDVTATAVVGGKDEIKREIPVGFVVLKGDRNRKGKEIE